MAKPTERDQKFIDYLQTLVDNRAALAHLRRGLGQSPGAEPQMFPYVARWMKLDEYWHTEQAYYLIAALFAYHPDTATSGNMGDHFARLCHQQNEATALERRFVNLLAAHPDDLARFHLRQVVSYLKSHDIAINWAQLLADVQGWGHPNRRVQTQWAKAFWAGTQPAPTEDEIEIVNQ